MSKNLTTIEKSVQPIYAETLEEQIQLIKVFNQYTDKGIKAVAKMIEHIYTEELYKSADGLKFHEVMNQQFGYKKASVYMMIKVAKTFIDSNGRSRYYLPDSDDFSYTQLSEMIPRKIRGKKVTIDDIDVAVYEHNITPYMSCKEIKNYIENHFGGEIIEDNAEENSITEEADIITEESAFWKVIFNCNVDVDMIKEIFKDKKINVDEITKTITIE